VVVHLNHFFAWQTDFAVACNAHHFYTIYAGPVFNAMPLLLLNNIGECQASISVLANHLSFDCC
jgi:hypothetical protein